MQDQHANPPDPNAQARQELSQLLNLMRTLRAPDGCPWDQVQTFDTIAPYTIEEAYEVADAIARRDMAALPDELGDLLFQVVYHAEMAAEAGLFDFAAVARSATAKMIRRHPHLFPTTQTMPAASSPPAFAPTTWEAHKQAERAARTETRTLDGIPTALPALTRALKLTARAGRVGFDWPNAAQVLDKLDEEIAELRAELPGPDLSRPTDPARLTDELGDLLFVVANLARKLELDPEACLRHANEKFARRFEGVETRLAAQGLAPADATLEQMEHEWQQVKAAERTNQK